MGIGLPDPESLYHISLDPRFGLFWLSPVLVLAILGFVPILKKSTIGVDGLVSLYAVVTFLAVNSGYSMWWGGNAFGPRYLIPALPFFIVPLSFVATKWPRALAALAVLSIAQMLIPLLGDIQPPISYQPAINAHWVGTAPFRGFSILYEYGIPQISERLAAGNQSWMLGTAIGLPYWLSPLFLIAAELLLIAVFYRLFAVRKPAEAAQPPQ